MPKLFEIPIYALNVNKLKKRVHDAKSRLNHKYKDYTTDSLRRCYDLISYPQRLWEYNHVVGYIQINFDKGVILFELFLPEPCIARYYWKSRKKIFLYNINVPGLDIYITEKMDNFKIRERLFARLDYVIDCVIGKYIPEGFFVDRQAFDQLNPIVDYVELLKQYDTKT